MTQQEYEHLYMTTLSTVIAYAETMCGSHEDAEDIAQDAFVSMLDNLPNIDYKGSKSYLYTSIHNRVIDLFRRNKTKQEVTYTDSICTDIDCDEYPELHSAITNLPAKQASAIYLYYWKQMNYAEIANELNISERAVHPLLWRAKNKLREIMINEG